MIVLIINEDEVLAIGLEGQPPVAADPYGPALLQLSLQWMELPAWNIHVLRATGDLKPLRLTPKPVGMRGLNTRLDSLQEEAVDAFVAEALDHEKLVS